MMENPWFVAGVTVAIIALSAFFVAVEFALIAARRHRIEDAAATSRSARAALRSANELTLLLAGSQLGITVCTLALGAITKPAVHHWLTPLFESWGLPEWPADVAGFVLALIVVTFLHLVVGEMAPKSWAIAHPERSAIMLAIPMRGFMAVSRPVLRWMNESANWCLRKVGVEASDSISAGQDSAALRHLLEHSADVGSLDASQSASLAGALELETLTLGDIVVRKPLTAVPTTAAVEDVQEISRSSGHLRILVDRHPGGTTPERDLVGVVHVRDTLSQPEGTSITDLIRPLTLLRGDMTVYDALAHMRRTSAHLILVTEPEALGADQPDQEQATQDVIVGVITMADLLHRLFPVSATA